MAIYRMEDHPLSGIPLDTISYAGNAPFSPPSFPCHPLSPPCYPFTTLLPPPGLLPSLATPCFLTLLPPLATLWLLAQHKTFGT